MEYLHIDRYQYCIMRLSSITFSFAVLNKIERRNEYYIQATQTQFSPVLKSWILIPLKMLLRFVILPLTSTYVLTKEYPRLFPYRLSKKHYSRKEAFAVTNSAFSSERELILSGRLFCIHILHANPHYFHAKQIDFQMIQKCNEINSWLTR